MYQELIRLFSQALFVLEPHNFEEDVSEASKISGFFESSSSNYKLF